MNARTLIRHAWSLSLLTFLGLACSSSAQSTSYTPPAGYFLIPVQGQTDNHVSIPLVQKSASFGEASAATSNSVTMTSKAWTQSQFKLQPGTQDATYYAEFISGNLTGVSYQILDNSDDTLYLDTQGDDLTAHPRGAIASGDVIRIRPLWTIGQIFGATEDQLILDPRPNPLVPGDSVLLLDSATVGINKAPNAEIAYIHNLGWRATGDQVTDYVDQPFQLGEPFVVRRMDAQGLNLLVVGYVLTNQQVLYVAGGNGTSDNDSYVSVVYPEPVALGQSGLYDPNNPGNSVLLGSSNALLLQDQLLSYGNNTGLNVAPTQSFFYLNNVGWQEVGSGSGTVGTDVLLQPGSEYILRKKATNGGVDWVQTLGGN